MSDDRTAAANLSDLVREAAHRGPDRPALAFSGRTLTWAQLDAEVDAAAAGLRDRLGLAEGDRVALALPNGLDFPVAYFGALRAGLTALPVNPSYTARELSWILADSGARALVGTRAVVEAVEGIKDQLPALEHTITTGSGFAGLLAPGERVESRRGGEDLAVLMYTSGTSGRPKGAMLTHRALLANLDQCARIQPAVLEPDDVVLLVVPMIHVFGLNPGLGMVARTGCSAVVMERFDPVSSLHAIQEHGITNVIGAPPMFLAWSLLPELAECFAGVRLAVSGAAPLDADAQRRLLKATGQHVFEGYGLTETAPVLSSTLMCEVPKPGSIGRPLPGIELRLVDTGGQDIEAGADEDDDEELAAGAEEPGEIVVRGAHLFSGYWPDGADGPDAEGWWATGDVAYRDDDGDLFLVDRVKELILVSGFNVYPREIEDVLLGHPEITEAAVLGVDHPYTGQTVKAYVVLADGATLTAEDVERHCEKSLARFKCPTAVEFVAQLPHSATGKVAKAQLREPVGEN